MVSCFSHPRNLVDQMKIALDDYDYVCKAGTWTSNHSFLGSMLFFFPGGAGVKKQTKKIVSNFPNVSKEFFF